jgi:hypothetical protein
MHEGSVMLQNRPTSEVSGSANTHAYVTNAALKGTIYGVRTVVHGEVIFCIEHTLTKNEDQDDQLKYNAPKHIFCWGIDRTPATGRAMKCAGPSAPIIDPIDPSTARCSD